MFGLPFEVVMLAGSLAAILALTGLNALLGGWRPARIATAAEAEARLDADLLGFQAEDALLCPTGRAALLGERGATSLGLVVARGDGLVTRRLAPGPGVRAQVTRRGDLVVRLDDLTLPRVRFRCGDRGAARAWADRLAPAAGEGFAHA